MIRYKYEPQILVETKDGVAPWDEFSHEGNEDTFTAEDETGAVIGSVSFVPREPSILPYEAARAKYFAELQFWLHAHTLDSAELLRYEQRERALKAA